MLFDFKGVAVRTAIRVTFISILTFLLAVTTPSQALSASDLSFTDVFDPAVFTNWTTVNQIIAVDFDDDGWIDLFFPRRDGLLPRLFLNDQNGSFTESNADLGIIKDLLIEFAVLGDIDNDGDEDILGILNGNSLHLFYRTGQDFQDVSPPAFSGTAIFRAGLIDSDNDGDLDVIAVAIDSPKSLILYVNDSGNFLPSTLDVDAGRVGVADLDQDGLVDLLVTHARPVAGPWAPYTVLRNDGGNTFTSLTGTGLPGLPAYAPCFLDYDNDGDLDIYQGTPDWGNPSHPWLFRTDGPWDFFDDSMPSLDVGSHYYAAAIPGDPDRDGDVDFFNAMGAWTHSLYFENDSGLDFVERSESLGIGVGGGNTGKAGVWFDYDKDADLDLFVANTWNASGGWLFRNDVTTGNWLTVLPQPMYSNRSLRGTTVTVSWDGKSQIQHYEQNLSIYPDAYSREKVFGLGAATVVDTITVSWGSGHVTQAFNLGVNQHIEMPECGGVSTLFSIVNCDLLFELGSARGAAWVDLGGENGESLYITRGEHSNVLLNRLDGGGWGPETPDPIALISDGSSTIWLDLQNDGTLDTYVANQNQPNNLVWNLENLGFFESTPSVLLDPGPSRGLSAADYDLDGDLDIFLARSSAQPNLLAVRNEQDVFGDGSHGPFLEAYSSLMGVWGDYDNDGDPDLYVVNWSYPNQLLRNDGGVFTDIAVGSLANVGNGNGAAWGDYDNDGLLDLYVTGGGTANLLLHNDGSGSFSDVTPTELADAGNSNSPCWIDYDNDGWVDLYWNTGGGANRLFKSDGGLFSEVSYGPIADSGNSTSAAWSDYDGDGDQDVFVADYDSNGISLLLRNDLDNGNHWLEVDLYGLISNRYGVGTRIRAVTGSVSQIREVAIGSGTMAQHSLTAHFGLGSATTVDSLILRWPSGIVQTLVDVPADQRFRILESDVSTEVPETPERPSAFALGDAIPNPFNPSTTISYSIPVAGYVELEVYDLAGRRVRTLVGQQVAAGTHEVHWNGADDAGAPVASGVYLYRLKAGQHVETKRMVLLK